MIDEVGGKLIIQSRIHDTMKVFLAGRDKVTCGMTANLYRGLIIMDSRWKKMKRIIAIVSMV